MKTQKTGQFGEELAMNFLLSKGYEILETNWRYSKAEIDIIGKIDNILVFIEVKTRSSNRFGRPEDFVSESQVNLLAKAANIYMEQVDHDWEIRFDVISVLLSKNKDPEIEHLEDAFFPDWN